MSATTQLHGWGTYTMTARVEDTVINYCGDFASDYDIEGLANAFRDEINAKLAGTTIVLCGDDFYADYPAPEGAAELIEEAIEEANLAPLLDRFDNSRS